MGFFFNEAKKADKVKPKPKSIKLTDIPVTSLNKLGCSVCSLDKAKLKSPKMTPSGAKNAKVYLLGASPSTDDDELNNHWADKAGAAIYKVFSKNFLMDKDVRSNYITQCMGPQTHVEIECCRQRVVADIEATKPLIIVGVGDGPLYWATGLSGGGALPHRGTMFTVKVGNHVCFYYCLLYPNFVHKKSYKKSEYELALEHDVADVKARLKDLPEPVYYSAPYTTGVEVITGNEPGDMNRLAKALSELARLPKSSVDIETNGLRPYMLKDPAIYTVAVGTFNRTVAFALDHPEGWGTVARRKQVWALFGQYLMDSGRKCAHNLAMELEWFGYFFGGQLLGMTEWDDTMLACHTMDERSGTKSLGMQTRINFGFDVKKQSNIDVKRLLDYPLRDVLLYNGMDTKWTDKLRDVLMARLYLNDLYVAEYERKLRLAPALVLTEMRGLPTDLVYAAELGKTMEASALTLEGKIARCPEVREYNTKFGTFSPTNPDHVLKLMRDLLHRPEVRDEDKRTGVVRWTSDEEALSAIPAPEVPSAGLILEHRGLSKLLSTYVRPVIAKTHVCTDGRMRGKYSSTVAVTGRLAVEDPNVQNWPKRKNKEIRGIVYAEQGRWLLACDYGQIEFRVAGMASEDKNLVAACWTGYDVHKFWAERLVSIYGPIKDIIVDEFKIDWDEKGIKTLRQEMKNKWVFPQIFGASLQSCAGNLHLPDYIAEDLGQEFWDEFQGVKRWQEKLLQKYEKNLYVETLGGRRRRGPMTKNEIINMPIQGTAFDIVGESHVALSNLSLQNDDPDLQPVLNVHDDLTFDIPDHALEDKLAVIAREMCLPRFDYINVPLVVEASVGSRWHDLTEIKVFRSDKLFNTPNPYK
jgi:uracil-DNA glycosylase family 4